MSTRPSRLAAVAFFVTLAISSGRALASGSDPEPAGGGASPAGKIDLALLGGVAVPVCSGQQGCAGDLNSGPSLAGLVLYAPNDRWAFGVVAQVSRVHWREPYIGMVDGQTYQIDADLTAGLAALAVRYTPLPELGVTPIVQAALGTGFQTQTGTNFQCNTGFMPTGQLAAGARARMADNFSLFGLASASWGFKLSECGVSDGAGATPFAGWGFGLHVGAAFDLAL